MRSAPAGDDAASPMSARLTEHRAAADRHARSFPPDPGVLVESWGFGDTRGERLVPHADATHSALYLHPGGYVTGSPAHSRQFASRLAMRLDAEVIVPAYALAPERPFPAGRDDVLRVYRSLVESPAAAQRTVVAGASAGAGLAVAALVAARDEDLPMPAGLVLLSPWVDLTGAAAQLGIETDSEQEADPDVVGSRRSLWEYQQEIADWYRAGLRVDDPRISPVFADLAGLPPTHIESSDAELLVGDSRLLADRLAAYGVRVELRTAPDAGHAYPHNQADSSAGRAAMDRIIDHLKGCLEHPWTGDRQ